jgi:hypothetical protein
MPQIERFSINGMQAPDESPRLFAIAEILRMQDASGSNAPKIRPQTARPECTRFWVLGIDHGDDQAPLVHGRTDDRCMGRQIGPSPSLLIRPDLHGRLSHNVSAR